MKEQVLILLLILGIYFALMLSGIHTINEGHVGIYKNTGILSPQLTTPGIHFMIPLFTTVEQIRISIQTDAVTNIPCGTSGGTLIFFDRIEVINRLKKEYVFETIKNYTSSYDMIWIHNKIHHEINQFCSRHTLSEIYIDKFEQLDEELKMALQEDLDEWAPGIEVISIRITKPRIPKNIRDNFETMENIKVEYFVASERQKVTGEKELTEQKKALIQGESKLDVRRIELEKEIKHRENAFKMAKIQAEISYERSKTEIDAAFMGTMKELELYPVIYSKNALNLAAINALTQNVTLLMGTSIPNIVTRLG